MVTRLLYFVYGCFAYLLFLATFLCAIAFVGGFGALTSLDGRATAPLTSALAVDALLLGVFAVQHSVMARPRSSVLAMAAARRDGVDDRAPGRTGARMGRLRVRLAASVGDDVLDQSLRSVGLRQVWLHLIGRHYTRVAFATPAPYRFVRHFADRMREASR
jgi:hypothetical protein